MKRMWILFGVLVCLAGLPFPSFAKSGGEEKEQQAYEEAISENWKETLKTGIELDKLSAANKASRLEWLEAEDPPEEAEKLVDQITELEKKQEKEQESMEPYSQARKTCDEKLNADGANAAMENIIRIQKDRIEDQEELAALWKKVEKLLS